MFPLTNPKEVLTKEDVLNQLLINKIDTFGLVIPAISSTWGTYNADTGTLTEAKAPFRCMYDIVTDLTPWKQTVSTGPAAALRMHPEAAKRLEKLSGGKRVPTVMLIHGVQPDKSNTQFVDAGQSVTDGAVSFHDSQGEQIDAKDAADFLSSIMNKYPVLSKKIEGPPLPIN